MRQWVPAESIGPRWQLRDGLRVLAEAWQWRGSYYWKVGLTGETVRCESLEQAKREADRLGARVTRLWVRTPSRSWSVAVDVDADGVAHLHTSGKKWSFRVGQGGFLEEVSDHPKAAAGREDAREIAFRAFEMMLAS